LHIRCVFVDIAALYLEQQNSKLFSDPFSKTKAVKYPSLVINEKIVTDFRKVKVIGSFSRDSYSGAKAVNGYVELLN
jgi:hypothetical protein